MALVRPGVVMAVLAVLGACGGSGSGSSSAPRVDAKEVETLLVQRQRERNPRLKVASATCPRGIDARLGETFQCSVDVEGQPAWFTVRIAEVLGQKARFDFVPVQAVVDVAGVTDFLRSRLEPDWRTAKVDCGQSKVRLMDVGATIECTVFNGAVTRYIQAVVEDKDGTVSLRER